MQENYNKPNELDILNDLKATRYGPLTRSYIGETASMHVVSRNGYKVEYSGDKSQLPEDEFDPSPVIGPIAEQIHPNESDFSKGFISLPESVLR